MRKIIRYAGIRGDHAEREVLIACRGSASYGYEYLGVYEGKRFKILRASRVLEMRDPGAVDRTRVTVAEVPAGMLGHQA